jgi:DNA-binding CsgD family transcriptional regulator
MLADTLEMQSVMLSNLERTVDSLATGVILTDKRGVTYMNSSAKALIDSGDAMRIKDNKLCLAKARDGGALEQALSQSLNGIASPTTGSYAVAIPRTDAAGVLANVLPLSWRDGPNPLAAMSGTAAVLIQDASQPPQFEGEALARLYRLTPTELQVALEIARGKTLQDIADTLSITMNTIKTHLKHIFAKTGVTRQGELMRLIMLSSRPVRNTAEK